ncbi:MAG TPA: basic amino acid ABC transporter substrate-binding protein [Anaerolineaceae bacterium]|nr:basic amino acid ABC transporter substrate-binding protein [Anaerolineaceae bacterium]
MKRSTLFLLSVILILAMALSACAKAAPTVKVATDATFNPFEYTDENGNLIGFDIDLMNEIAKKANVKFEWVNVPFDSVLAGLAQCQYDVAIAAISITDDRKAEMLFTAPYLDAGLIVVVNKENTTINSLADLTGLKVAAQLGTTGEIEAQKIEGVDYKPYDSYELAFLELANKGVDAVIADNPVAMGYVAANPDKLKLVGEVFNSDQYGIAICKNNADLQAALDKALKELLDSGFVAQLAEKYLK